MSAYAILKVMNDAKPSMGGVISSRSFGASGFTIVETLIVLAITGFLLFIALLTFAGQQSKVEFTQSIRDIQSVIQQTVNEVGSGFYPNGGDIHCTASGASFSITQSPTEQGTNSDCIFMGKVMQFGIGGPDPQQYNVFSLAGLKNNDGDIVKARPQVIDIKSAITNAQLHGGIRVVKMTYVSGGSPTNIGAVAFVSGLGTLDSSNQLLSGTQQMSLIPIPASGEVPDTLDSEVIDAVKSRIATAPVNPDGGVQICFASGGTKQTGLITIGSGGRGVTVKLDIKNTADCT
jgi:type II secretory pathway pseudopilin PulG